MVLLHKAIDFLTSLRLTVVTLALALGLVFIGTIAQVKWGLYIVQEKYFQSTFVWWDSPAGFSIPVWPGGYLLGWVLLINLIAAHIKRFEICKKKIGIFIIHAGIILLLVGQFLTELFQVESFMAIPEKSSRRYSESGREHELVLIDSSDPLVDKVIAIPERKLREGEIAIPEFPFKIKVESFLQNTHLSVIRNGSTGASGTHDIHYANTNQATSMDDKNWPVAKIQLVNSEGASAPVEVSTYLSDDRMIAQLSRQFGSMLKRDFAETPILRHEGKDYRVYFRAVRYYKDHEIQLIDFTHDKYAGTQIPKNFSSRVKVVNPVTREDREVLIYMNNPLRYGGETYYQGGFFPDDSGTILQVVRNPSWLTPYIACALVGGGLLVQFLSHLFAFAKKKRSA